MSRGAAPVEFDGDVGARGVRRGILRPLRTTPAGTIGFVPTGVPTDLWEATKRRFFQTGGLSSLDAIIQFMMQECQTMFLPSTVRRWLEQLCVDEGRRLLNLIPTAAPAAAAGNLSARHSTYSLKKWGSKVQQQHQQQQPADGQHRLTPRPSFSRPPSREIVINLTGNDGLTPRRDDQSTLHLHRLQFDVTNVQMIEQLIVQILPSKWLSENVHLVPASIHAAASGRSTYDYCRDVGVLTLEQLGLLLSFLAKPKLHALDSESDPSGPPPDADDIMNDDGDDEGVHAMALLCGGVRISVPSLDANNPTVADDAALTVDDDGSGVEANLKRVLRAFRMPFPGILPMLGAPDPSRLADEPECGSPDSPTSAEPPDRRDRRVREHVQRLLTSNEGAVSGTQKPLLTPLLDLAKPSEHPATFTNHLDGGMDQRSPRDRAMDFQTMPLTGRSSDSGALSDRRHQQTPTQSHPDVTALVDPMRAVASPELVSAPTAQTLHGSHTACSSHQSRKPRATVSTQTEVPSFTEMWLGPRTRNACSSTQPSGHVGKVVSLAVIRAERREKARSERRLAGHGVPTASDLSKLSLEELETRYAACLPAIQQQRRSNRGN